MSHISTRNTHTHTTDALNIVANALRHGYNDFDDAQAYKSTKEYKKLLEIVKACKDDEVKKRMIEILPVEVLSETGIVSSTFRRKLIKANTKIKYKQEKYNLLREQSEGFSKLVTVLSQPELKPDDVRSLIGRFKLDPNRVFDVVLEILERRPELTSTLCELLRNEFENPHYANQIGFKFQAYSSRTLVAPEGLYSAAARCIQHGVFTVEQIWPHLSPSDDEIRESMTKTRIKLSGVVRKIGVVNLNAKPGEVRAQANQQPWVYENLPDGEAEGGPRHYDRNQKFRLLAASCRINDLESIVNIENRLRLYCGVTEDCFASIDLNVRDALLSVVRDLVSGLASSSVAVKATTVVKPLESLRHLSTSLTPTLSRLGVMIGCDASLHTTLCRLLGKAYKNKHVLNDEKEVQSLEHLLGKILLPAISLIQGSNPVVPTEIWEVLRHFPYSTRYEMYASMEIGDHIMGDDAIVRRTRRLSMYATKSSLKQLTSETQRNVGRKFAKISHRDPLTLLNHLVNRIESYENMIDPVVESFKFLNPLTIDILSYVLVRHVASDRM